MAKKVIVYLAEWCVWCHRATDFLKENKIPFEERDVDKPEYAKEAMAKSGQGGVPVIDIDGTIIVGFDVGKIKQLLEIK